MNGNDERKKRPMRLPAIVFAVAMMLTVLCGSGAITQTVSAESPSAELELAPHYKDVTYVLDQVTLLQRFDTIGDWSKISDASLADSRLVMDADEGASITISGNLATYFESRLMFNSTNATVTMKLSDGTNYTAIAIAAAGTVTATFNNGSAQTVVVAASGAVKESWIKVGIEFTADGVVFTASNATALLGTKTFSTALLGFKDITSMEIKSTATGVVGYADYAFASITQTDFVAATLNDSKLNSDPALTEKFQKFKVAFTDDAVPATYSDESVTHALYGDNISDKSLASDRYLNETDMGEMLAAHAETKNEVTGTATYQGWEDLYNDNEDTLQTYLANEHDVSKDTVTVIDYYMDGVGLNYTFNSAMTDAVENAWFKYSQDMADNLGAQTSYSDEASVADSISGTMAFSVTGKDPVDLDYFYFPTSVEQKEFDDAMDDLSDQLREKTIGGLVIVPETFQNITLGAKTNPNAYATTPDGSVWNNAFQSIDSAYQATDAALGAILQGASYMVFDLDAMSAQLGWSVMEDGKLSSSPLTFASCYGSEVVAYGALIVLIAIPLVAIIVVGGVFGAKKVRGKKRNQ